MAGGRRMAGFDTQTARYRSQFGIYINMLIYSLPP
jgi:hypothetical protein